MGFISKHTHRERILQIIYVIMGEYPKYIKNSCNSVTKYTIKYYSVLEKEWNLAISNNMDDGPWGHYTVRQRKTNTVWFHLYVKSKNTKQSKSDS